tara:strand:- start:462 stop:929 length:468 start_codon:yes stop_codon:yes gene_type:complete
MVAGNKKRKKASRMRGSKTHGVGFMKKGRGSGHRGGVGMAGTGKRADHKKSLILNTGEKYFGKVGLKAKPKNYLTINVSELERMADGKKELNLSKYKILGNGEIGVALTISAYGASKVAIEKVEGAGGKIIIEESEEVETEDEDSKDEGNDKKEE